MGRARWAVQPGGVRGLPGGSGVSGGVVRMSRGTQVTGGEEGPSRPTSGAKAERTEEVKGKWPLWYSIPIFKNLWNTYHLKSFAV